MSHSSPGLLDPTDATRLFSEVARRVHNEIDLLEVSSRCRVNPTTLRKILEARPISYDAGKKIFAGLRSPTAAGEGPVRPSRVERLRTIHRLYQEKGTLAAVGRAIGLSRERVRQMLVKGTKIGLFQYTARALPLPSREKILEDYRKLLSLEAISKENRLSLLSLRRLCRSYGITREELVKIQSDRRRMECVDLYITLAQEVGHHPTSTELQRLKRGRFLYWRIQKGWGSIETFRRALHIPRPRTAAGGA